MNRRLHAAHTRRRRTPSALSRVSVTAESLLADWDRPRVRRYNAEDQRLYYPNDKGFEFVPSLVEKQIVWGS